MATEKQAPKGISGDFDTSADKPGLHVYENLLTGYRQVVIGKAFVLEDPITIPEQNSSPVDIEKEERKFNDALDRAWFYYDDRLEKANNLPIEVREEAKEMLGLEQKALKSLSLSQHVESAIREKNQTAIYAIYGYYSTKIEAAQKKLERLVANETNTEEEENSTANLLRKSIEISSNILLSITQQFPDSTKAQTLENANDNDIPVTNGTVPVSEMSLFRREDGHGARMHGLLDTEGNPLSHAWIVAKASRITTMRIPRDLREKIRTGDNIIIDGPGNRIIHIPSQKTLQKYEARLKTEQAERKVLTHRAQIKTPDGNGGFLKAVPTSNSDMIKISANAGYSDEIQAVKDVNALTIGLYRTELAVLSRTTLPNEDLWYEIFEEITSKAENRPITFRTLDFAGDKVQTAFKNLSKDSAKQENVLRNQMQAAIRLQNDRPNSKICLMIPMVEDSEHFGKMRKLLAEETKKYQQKLDKRQVLIPKMGAMVETPGIVDEIKNIKAAFFSIGSNDLIPLIRGFNRYADDAVHKYDPTSKQVLTALKEILENTPEGKEVSLCGEMATNPAHFAILVGLGLRHLSVGVGMVPHIKELARRIDTDKATKLVQTLLETEKRAIREKILNDFNEEKIGLKPDSTLDMDFKYRNPVLEAVGFFDNANDAEPAEEPLRA